MKFAMRRASKDNWEGTKNFTTIDQLLQFIEENGDIIIGKNTCRGIEPDKEFNLTKEISRCNYQIVIYDDFIE